MSDKKIVLPKGQTIKFLDYTIKNSPNNDGLVLFKEGYIGYESHLGNYGTGSQKNIDTCKKYAILYFMAARPDKFATILVRKAIGSSTYLEYITFTDVLEEEGIEIPEEMKSGYDPNYLLHFKGKKLC